MFWDRVAFVYDIFANIINKKVHKKLKEIVANEITKEDDVLECACGTGMLTKVVAPRSKSIIATDFSSKMLKRAKKKCKKFNNVEFMNANIMKLEFDDNSFDIVIAANVIHLLDDPIKAINELDRVCKENGKIIIPTYMNNDEKGNTSGFAKRVGKAGANFKRQFTYDSYKEFFTDLGYKNVKYEIINGRVPCCVAIIKKIVERI